MSKLPDGWIQTGLGNGIVLLSGQHIDASDYTNEPGGVPYLTGPADFPDGKIFVTKYTTKPKVVCQVGDILLTVKGSGTGQIVRSNDRYCISRQLMAIRPINWNIEFIYYVLQANSATYGANAAGLIPGITREDVLNTQVFLPPLPEQRTIAAILSTWDEAITLTEALIAALQQRKQALMQLLLTGAVRFQEFEGSEWEEARIEEIAQVNTHILSENTHPEKQFYYIDLSSIRKGNIDMPDKKITFQEAPSRARRILYFGDVIMATVRPNLQGFGLCDFDPIDVICSTGFALISPDDLRDSRYIYQNLFSRSILDQIQNLVTGSNYPAINANEVKKLILPLPENIKEREKIGDFLSTCDSEIVIFERLKDTLQTQKRALMQQLLTGAIRVPGIE